MQNNFNLLFYQVKITNLKIFILILVFVGCKYQEPVFTSRIANGKLNIKNFTAAIIVVNETSRKYANQAALLANASSGGYKTNNQYDLYLANYQNKKIEFIKKIITLEDKYFFEILEVDSVSIKIKIFTSFANIYRFKIYQIYFDGREVLLESYSTDFENVSKFIQRSSRTSKNVDKENVLLTFKLDQNNKPIWKKKLNLS